MTTGITLKELSRIYKIPKSTLYEYLLPHRNDIDKLASTTTVNGKERRAKKMNCKQITFIITEVLKGDQPEGKQWTGNEFVAR